MNPKQNPAIGDFLKLRDQKPINNGEDRLVFIHPEDPNFVVKVIRPEVIDKRFGSGTKWYKRRRRYGRFISYVRETQEYIAASLAHEKPPVFLPKIVGFVETDYGLGFINSAARRQSGEIAPNLRMLIKSGEFDIEARQNLHRFRNQILASPIVIADLHARNLVYAWNEKEGNHFILIDGFGSSTLIPLKQISVWANRRSKIKRFEYLEKQIFDLHQKAENPMSEFTSKE